MINDHIMVKTMFDKLMVTWFNLADKLTIDC